MHLFVLGLNFFIRQCDADGDVLFGRMVYGVIPVVRADDAVFPPDGIERAEQFEVFRKFFFNAGAIAVVALVALGVGEYGLVAERFGNCMGFLLERCLRDAVQAVTTDAFVLVRFSDVDCAPVIVGIDVIAFFDLALDFQKVAHGALRIWVIPDYQ